MTTTARELAEKLRKIINPSVGVYEFNVDELVCKFEQAILDAEARGRESVLSRVPSEDEIEEQLLKLYKSYNDSHWHEAAILKEWLLAKLKEPT